jgi:hypothetical protein
MPCTPDGGVGAYKLVNSCYTCFDRILLEGIYKIWVFPELRHSRLFSIDVGPRILSGIGQLRGCDANNRPVLVV